MNEIVYEISREPVKGVIGLVVIVEVIYWAVMILNTVGKWVREWRTRRRKRYERLETYRPEHDRRHPHHRRAA